MEQEASSQTIDNAVTVPRWGTSRIVAHQLAPGCASLVVFIVLAWILRDSWVPLMATLFFSILLGEAPLCWYLMIRAQRSDNRPASFDSLFPWHRRIGLGRTVGLGLGLALVGMLSVFGLAMMMEPVIQLTLFGWVPGWLLLQAGPDALSGVNQSGLLLIWALSGVVGIAVGGLTQELYHRGFLLPRAAHLGWISVPMNGALFAAAHFVAPWGWPFFFLAATVWGGAVYRWQSIQLGLAGHLGMLTLGWLMMTGMVLGIVPAP